MSDGQVLIPQQEGCYNPLDEQPVLSPDEAGPRSWWLDGFMRYPANQAVPIRLLGRHEGPHYQPSPALPAAPLIEVTDELMLSTHFLAADFACSDESYLYVRVHPVLVQKLEELNDRLKLDQEVVVLSGYRPPEFNRLNGGSPDSPHVNGLAADIVCPGVPLRKLHELAKDVFDGFGHVELFSRDSYIHVDVTLAVGQDHA